MRVVSLLPSATELLCAVGAEDLLVGRSHECDCPSSIVDRPVLTAARIISRESAAIDAEVRRVLRPADASWSAGQGAAMSASPSASLYTVNARLLESLKPDVILTQDLCEVCSIDLNAVRAIAASFPSPPRIVSLNPSTLEDVLDDLLRVGEAVEHEQQAETAAVHLRDRLWTARDAVTPYVDGPEVAFLEWIDPLFIAGHWTPQLIEWAGARHSLNAAGSKSIRIEPEQLLAAKPDRIIIGPCGFDLVATQRDLHVLLDQAWWNELPAVRAGGDGVMLVDGNAMFSRPGPRLIDALEWLVGWIQERPELIPRGFPALPLSRVMAREP